MLQRKNEIFNSVLDAFISEGVLLSEVSRLVFIQNICPIISNDLAINIWILMCFQINANKTTNYVVNMLKDMNLKNVNVTSL